MSTFLNLVINGVALGAAYALVALAFVIIYKATGVINFAQGIMMLGGALLAYSIHDQWGLSFYPALIVSLVCGALIGIVIERLIMRFLVGQPAFAQLMVTIGILFVLTEVCNDIWGVSPLVLTVPWSGTVRLSGATIAVANLWRIGFTAVAMLAFFLFFRYSATGLSMRATALDQEAALAQGISARRVYITAWGVSGAVVGGLVIGISQNIASQYFPMNGFDQVFPYVIMIGILLIRPFGLWGTKEVRRI